MFPPPIKAKPLWEHGQTSDMAAPSQFKNCRDKAPTLAHIAPLCKLGKVPPKRGIKTYVSLYPAKYYRYICSLARRRCFVQR